MEATLPPGVKVYFSHGRRVEGEVGMWYRTTGKTGLLRSWRDESKTLEHNGGFTLCFLVFPDGYEVVGEAVCGLKDRYNKEIGRKVSFGRALKKARQEYPEMFDETPLKLVKSPL